MSNIIIRNTDEFSTRLEYIIAKLYPSEGYDDNEL